jgi:S-(hydroxymethyl)glutathione dehydrogenase / alcohol dehydrogenase
MKMKAAVNRAYGGPITIEEIDLAPPKEHEVLVKTAYTGWCKSDYVVVSGRIKMPLPMVIGHEASGVVVEVGPGVTMVQKGDHVAASWSSSCGKCKMCLSGRENLCLDYGPYLGQGVLLDGTSRLSDAKGTQLGHDFFVSGFAEYMVIPEMNCLKLRKDLPLDVACFLGCCMPTGFGAVYNTGQVKPGDSVAVWGVGGVGLNVIQGAKVRGANPIIAVDLEGSKEAIAREFGATHFLNSSKEDPVPKVQEITGGLGADVIFEASGEGGAIAQLYWAMAKGGKHVQIGVHDSAEMVTMNFTYTPGSRKQMIGCLYGDVHLHKEVPAMADLLMDDKYIDLKKLISRVFTLDQINEAYQATEKRQTIGRWVCKF